MASETSEHVIVDFANSNTSNNNTVTASTRFRWDKEQKVENLIRCLAKCRQSSAVRGSQKILFLEAAKTLSRHIKPEQNRGENF